MSQEIAKRNVEALYKMEDAALHIDKDATYDEWNQIGMVLVRIHNSEPFWIGDWINYGEKKFGETYSEAKAITHLEYGTLAHYKMVATKIPKEERVASVSFSHHRMLSNVEPKERRRLLEMAAKDALSVLELKETAGQQKPKEANTRGEFLCDICEKKSHGKKGILLICLDCDRKLRDKERDK